MSDTTANNITKKHEAVHEALIFVSDTPHSDGKQINDNYEILEIIVLKTANKISYAKLKIADGSVAQQDFEVSNEDVLIPGKFITIKMGDLHSTETVFKGEVIKHGIKIRQNSNSILQLDCRDVAVCLTTQKKSGYFGEDVTDVDAFEECVGQYKKGGKKIIQTNFEPTENSHEGLVQYNASDWDFILTRAIANAQLLYTDNGILKTVTPTVKDTADYTLTYGEEIIEFEAEIDAKNQFDEVIGQAWDSAKQELTEEALKQLDDSVQLGAQGNLANKELARVLNDNGLKLPYAGNLTAKELKNWVKSELMKSKLARIIGRVSFVSSVIVQPLSTIDLKGVGDRFNGKTIAIGARYEFAKNRWKTDLQFGLSRDWGTRAQSSEQDERLIPSMSGLHIGVVTRLDDDKGEDRVKVRVPFIDEKGEGVWAKLARPDAGEHRGLFFIPELDDEVLVGFVNCDPRYPVIVGMLNSSAKPAPVLNKDKDNLKGYYSKAGSRVEFDDKNQTIKIQTLSNKEAKELKDFRSAPPNLAKNNTIILDEKNGTILIQDQNKNQIELSKKGILIKADKKITLDAKKIELIAKDELKTDTGASSLVSTGKTTINGSQINLN